jgi:hypothetical protein
MLAISLAASPIAAAAQEPIAPPEPRGPIARALTPAAVRVAMLPVLSEPQKSGEQASLAGRRSIGSNREQKSS